MAGGSCIVLSISSRRVAAGFLSLSALIDGFLVGITGRFLSSREGCMTGGSWIVRSVSSTRVALGFLSSSDVTDSFLVGITGSLSSFLYIFSCGVAGGLKSSSAVTKELFV